MQGIRTHVLLVIAMALVIAIVTSLCVLLIRHRLRAQVTDDLSQDLDRSVVAFQNLQAERLGALERENALLAELPTLKALMTSGDDLTIQDGAVEFWQLSGDDLFALADPGGRVVAAYTKGVSADKNLRQELKTLLVFQARSISSTAGRCTPARSARCTSAAMKTVHCWAMSSAGFRSNARCGRSANHRCRSDVPQRHRIVASTLEPSVKANFATQPLLLSGTPRTPATVKLGNAQFLAATEDLSATATSPLQLVVLKSFEPAERSISRIDRMVLIAGFLALILGHSPDDRVSRLVTRPLEELSRVCARLAWASKISYSRMAPGRCGS